MENTGFLGGADEVGDVVARGRERRDQGVLEACWEGDGVSPS